MSDIFGTAGLQGSAGPPMPACVAATTGALPAYTASSTALVANANGALPAQDGITLAAGEYLLVKDESGGNAPYNLITRLRDVGSASTPWALTIVPGIPYRCGLSVCVGLGTVNTRKFFILTTRGSLVVGTSALTWQGNL